MDEARKKAGEEIRRLFDRYGVKDQELMGNNFWKEATSWIQYLTNLTDSQEIAEFVARMKKIIILAGNKKNQKLINSPLDTARQTVNQQIQELFNKYNQVSVGDLDKKLWNNATSWQNYLEQLTDTRSISQFARAMREAIIQSNSWINNNPQEEQNNKEKRNKNKFSSNSLILGTVIFVVLLVITFIATIVWKKANKR